MTNVVVLANDHHTFGGRRWVRGSGGGRCDSHTVVVLDTRKEETTNEKKE